MLCLSLAFCVAHESAYWFGKPNESLSSSYQPFMGLFLSFFLLNRDGEGEALRVQSRQPGSRLKTPGLPIWVRYHLVQCLLACFGLSSLVWFHVGHEHHGSLRHHIQFESGTLEELSRGKTLRASSLHVHWLFRFYGESQLAREPSSTNDTWFRFVFRLSTTEDRMMAMQVAINCSDKTAKEKRRKATLVHYKRRQLKSLFTRSGLKAKSLSSKPSSRRNWISKLTSRCTTL